MAADHEEGEERVHVLLVAFSAQGHINPMLKLGRLLASKGLEVSLATTEDVRQKILNSHTKYHPIHLEFFSDGLPLDFDRKTHMDFFFRQLQEHGSRNLSDLISTLSTKHHRTFSCIINNPFVPWVADAALKHGIPCAMLWIQPCALFSIYYRFYRALNPFPPLDHPEATVLLPGLPALTTHDLPSFILPSNDLTIMPSLLSELFHSMEKLTWVFGNSFFELEKDAIESMEEIQPFIPVGPLVPSAILGREDETDVRVELCKVEDSCIEWLDKQEPNSVVYISFGSVVVLSKKQMENVAMALKKSKKPFLWVATPPDSQAEDGKGELPNGFVTETEGQGLVVQWCSQGRVLAHDAVACFMTHCGWNSTLESVCSGVPVIAYPHWTDQPTNAKLLVDVWEMGVRVEKGDDGVVSREEVERCIEEVTRGPKAEEMRKRAVEWKEAARAAASDGGSSDRNLQVFVEYVMTRARKKAVMEPGISSASPGVEKKNAVLVGPT